MTKRKTFPNAGTYLLFVLTFSSFATSFESPSDCQNLLKGRSDSELLNSAVAKANGMVGLVHKTLLGRAVSIVKNGKILDGLKPQNQPGIYLSPLMIGTVSKSIVDVAGHYIWNPQGEPEISQEIQKFSFRLLPPWNDGSAYAQVSTYEVNSAFIVFPPEIMDNRNFRINLEKSWGGQSTFSSREDLVNILRQLQTESRHIDAELVIKSADENPAELDLNRAIEIWVHPNRHPAIISKLERLGVREIKGKPVEVFIKARDTVPDLDSFHQQSEKDRQ